MGVFDALRAEIADKKNPQRMRILCGEMSAQEMRTAQALVSWFLRMCDRHEPEVPQAGGLSPDLARIIAQKCVNNARRSHPDSVSSAALRSVEQEIAALFKPEEVYKLLQSHSKRPERASGAHQA